MKSALKGTASISKNVHYLTSISTVQESFHSRANQSQQSYMGIEEIPHDTRTKCTA